MHACCIDGLHVLSFPCSYSRLQTDPPSSVPMSLSAPTLRPGPYTLQPPAGASGRLAAMTRPGGATYGGPSFSSQLHHGYSFNPQSSQTAGFSFQNTMLFPGSQGSSVLPPPPPPPPLPSAASLLPSTSSMPLPDSPVSYSNSTSKCLYA